MERLLALDTVDPLRDHRDEGMWKCACVLLSLNESCVTIPDVNSTLTGNAIQRAANNAIFRLI